MEKESFQPETEPKEKLERFEFIPRILKPEGEGPERKSVEKEGQPISITIVGERGGDPAKNKELMGRYAVRVAMSQIEDVQKEGKTALFFMATGKTYNWERSEDLLEAVKTGRVDPDKVIVTLKEDCWDHDGQHMPPGDVLDFRGKRIRGFHDVVGIEPQNAQVSSDGEISGNILAPDYDMSPEESVKYLNETWQALMKTGEVKGVNLSGVGEDLHAGEMQINKASAKEALPQRDWFIQDEQSYSRARGLFKWQKSQQEFYPNSNVFLELQEDGTFESAGRAKEYHGFGKILGVGWRALLNTEGGATFSFDTAKKALATRMALEGSFDGQVKKQNGEVVADIERDAGEGLGIMDDLMEFTEELSKEGILESGFVEEIRNRIKKKELYAIVDDVLEQVYQAYEDQKILAKNDEQREKYFEPIWRLVNKYVGKRSPLSALIRGLARNGVKIELVMTPEAAQELEFYQKS